MVAASGFVASVVHLQGSDSAVVRAVMSDPAEGLVHPWPMEHAPVLAMAVLLVLVFALFFVIMKNALAEIGRQAREIDACRQRLDRSERWALLGRRVAGVAHQLSTPLAFSKSNICMVVQALDDMAPGLHAAWRRVEAPAVGVGGPLVAQPRVCDRTAKSASTSHLPDDTLVLQDMLNDVLMSLDQMDELVNSLRLFTRLGLTPKETVNLGTVLHSVVNLARAAVPCQVKVVENWTELPSVDCHVARLTQAFVSVLLQAAQRIEGAGVITVSTSTEDRRIRVLIEDIANAASGIAPPRVFDPDFSASSAHGCPGLGLSTARDIVTAHGGSISIEAQAGVSTKVMIELPLTATAT